MTLALGLMSGTSCDGISAALVTFRGRRFQVHACRTFPYPRPITQLLHRILELPPRGLAQLHILLGELHALAALRLMRTVGVLRRDVAVIGSHGHTVYHGPQDPIPCTLQLGEPAVIAQRTGVPVVADFRMRDVAAGGQGAPLVPFFDDYFFGNGPLRAMQNIGGMANVSLVGRGIRPLAFDTGPGNCLLDTIVRRMTHGRQSYDAGGRLAARGRIDQAAVGRMWAHPYFRKAPPKSTGKELFNEIFLREYFGRRWMTRPHEALATLTFFTAFSIAASYRRFIPKRIQEVIVSGGGVYNRTLMRHLRRLLAPIRAHSIADFGLPPQAKEPVAFAFLALRAVRGQINHLPSTTGATQPCVLGKLIRV